MPGGEYRAPLDVRLLDAYNKSSTKDQDLLSILAKFTDMEELILNDASGLDVGFYSPGCGNAYMGPGGEGYRKQVENEGRQAAEKVARSVFQACAPLKRLWVGDWSRAEVFRDKQHYITDIKWYYEERPAPSGWIV